MPLAISNFCCLMIEGKTAPSDGGLNTTMVIGAGSAAQAGCAIRAASVADVTITAANLLMSPPPPRPTPVASALAYNSQDMVLDKLKSFKACARMVANCLARQERI